MVRRKRRRSAEESAHLRIVPLLRRRFHSANPVMSCSSRSSPEPEVPFKRPAPRDPSARSTLADLPCGRTDGADWSNSTCRAVTGRRSGLDVEREPGVASAVRWPDLRPARAGISWGTSVADTWSGMIGCRPGHTRRCARMFGASMPSG